MFNNEQITKDLVDDLSRDDLKGFGIPHGHVLRIEKALNKLKIGKGGHDSPLPKNPPKETWNLSQNQRMRFYCWHSHFIVGSFPIESNSQDSNVSLEKLDAVMSPRTSAYIRQHISPQIELVHRFVLCLFEHSSHSWWLPQQVFELLPKVANSMQQKDRFCQVHPNSAQQLYFHFLICLLQSPEPATNI